MFKGAASRCTSVLLYILWGFDISTLVGAALPWATPVVCFRVFVGCWSVFV
ncbi:hypothetical protein HMPREF0673_00898 [Leyella stercorea DSM 18206]|jgi:hypothetical protein|uniref:Uncharacterized protein n=1 Tax=Leyella stercorea DSM 18206 TaxID=1002367 RepID=G6AWA0_9BACT|nr:hypothetical protein HMPREF0673_00898 [Leyella stercorea DSM 18206]